MRERQVSAVCCSCLRTHCIIYSSSTLHCRFHGGTKRHSKYFDVLTQFNCKRCNRRQSAPKGSARNLVGLSCAPVARSYVFIAWFTVAMFSRFVRNILISSALACNENRCRRLPMVTPSSLSSKVHNKGLRREPTKPYLADITVVCRFE